MPHQLSTASLKNADSLRYLCKKDKNRVRKLIVDVATGDRKIHEVEEKLHMERDKFRRALLQLNQHIILLEGERIDILHSQQVI